MNDKSYVTESPFREFLINHQILVCDRPPKDEQEPKHVMIALAKKLGVLVEDGTENLRFEHIQQVADARGLHVPEPFYKGFPESVMALTKEQTLIDRFLHYCGFDQSVFESFVCDFKRREFDEDFEFVNFRCVSVEEADDILAENVRDMLLGSRRLSDDKFNVCAEYYKLLDHERRRLLKISSVSTAARLVVATKDIAIVTRHLKLYNFIDVVEELNLVRRGTSSIDKLNLKNQDRKLLTFVLDALFIKSIAYNETVFETVVGICATKRKQWVGVLHHIHYKPSNIKKYETAYARAVDFIARMRSKRAKSTMGIVNQYLEQNRPIDAVYTLCDTYGKGALVRNANYILSRCSTDNQKRIVAESMFGGPMLPMIQLYLSYLRYDGTSPRTFSFIKNGMLRTHKETEEEAAKRKSCLSMNTVINTKNILYNVIWGHYTGRVSGTVYVDPAMETVAMPLYETASQGGFGVLPTGSKMKVPDGKFVRAFVYWEQVNDIDLSCFLVSLSDASQKDIEFSWQARWDHKKSGIVFSGDETRGYDGGSEYFDIDIDKINESYPDAEYAVFAATVYSYATFKEVVCRAGFMMRDEISSGEVYEPKTVKTSFKINCDSTNAILFAIDLNSKSMIWINDGIGSGDHIAGGIPKGFISKYVDIADEFNVKTFFSHAANMTNDPTKADIIVSDEPVETDRDVEIIHSYDVEKLMMYLNL